MLLLVALDTYQVCQGQQGDGRNEPESVAPDDVDDDVTADDVREDVLKRVVFSQPQT